MQETRTPRLYTIRQAADAWMVSRDSIVDMCRRLGITVYQIGPKTLRIDADQFDEATREAALR